jgi:hypothetical protein
MLRMVVTLLVCLLWSCSSAPKPETKVKEPDPIVPVERDYHVSFDAAWSTVNETLEQYAMPIELTDKDNGIVNTGFIGGDVSDGDYVREKTTTGHGRRWIEETRYKLEIRVVRLSKEETRIQITALIQGKYSWANGNRYREGSWQNLISTGGVELDMQEEISARLSES